MNFNCTCFLGSVYVDSTSVLRFTLFALNTVPRTVPCLPVNIITFLKYTFPIMNHDSPRKIASMPSRHTKFI